MKTPKVFKLIDGNFTSEEAKELLINIFSNKIQFHQLKNFSSVERFGKEDKQSLNKIKELKKSVAVIKKIMEQDNKDNQLFQINAEVHISSAVFSKKE